MVAQATHFDFDLAPQTLSLQKLSACGLFDGYDLWMSSYVTKRYSFVRIQHLFKRFLVYFKHLSWAPCS